MWYEDLKKVVKCKCGCVYASRECANRVKGAAAIGVKRGPYKVYAANGNGRKLKYEKNGVSYQGKNVCLNYDDTNVMCVVCYEQGLYRAKGCRVKPK